MFGEGYKVAREKVGSGDQRIVHWCFSDYRREWTREYLTPIQEFVVKGSVFNSEAWQPGDRFLPNRVAMER